MADLFQNFSITEIILCVIGIVMSIEWAIEMKNSFGSEINKALTRKQKESFLYSAVDKQAEVQNSIQSNLKNIASSVNNITHRIDVNTEKLGNVDKTVDRIENNVKDLSRINRIIIKDQITNKHRTAMKNGYITEFDLETCERMYECYKRDHGEDSFIETFIKDIRNLPSEKEE